jgi:hypothetical protein
VVIAMTSSQITELRHQLKSHGYAPVPVEGKRPPFLQWQNCSANDVDLWPKLYPYAGNTGVLTKNTPTLDIDITNPEAADAVEELARERFEELGDIVVRFGKRPKRAIPLRTDEPFKKIQISLIAPNRDTDQKIEILADGQQVVVDGVHPETQQPYAWHGGEPWNTPRENLPYVREADMLRFVEEAADLLVREFGYRRADTEHAKKANGQDARRDADWARLVENIRQGRALHDSLLSLAAKLITSGMSTGAAVNHLRALMESSTIAHDDRWRARYDDIPRLVESAAKYRNQQDGGAHHDGDHHVHARAGEPQLARSAVLVRADGIDPESISWAWRNRFAFGKLAMIAGDPGLGKSTILIEIAALHSVGGEFPCGEGRAQQCEVVILTAEDGLRDTMVPRLMAAGADLSKIHFLTGTKTEGDDGESMFDLARDIAALRAVFKTNPDIKILIIDPLTAYLGATKAKENSEVRRTLMPLVKLIEDFDVCVLANNHLNKGAGKALYRILDSIAFVAVGRTVHIVIKDADNPDNRKLICDKTNIGSKPLGLTYIVQKTWVTAKKTGEEIETSQISWGTSHIDESADEALGEHSDPTATDDAVEFLKVVLAKGALGVAELEQEARGAGLLGEDQRLSQSKPFRSARKVLKVATAKDGLAGGWVWSLP